MTKNNTRKTTNNNAEQRRRDLAAIHIAKKQLGMDEATYREMLAEVAGVESAAHLDRHGRKKVLAHLWQRGFHPSKKSARGSGMHVSPSKERAPYLHKIGTLLEALELPWAYADGIAYQMFQVRFVRWLKPYQLRKLLIALMYHQKRKGI